MGFDVGHSVTDSTQSRPSSLPSAYSSSSGSLSRTGMAIVGVASAVLWFVLSVPFAFYFLLCAVHCPWISGGIPTAAAVLLCGRLVGAISLPAPALESHAALHSQRGMMAFSRGILFVHSTVFCVSIGHHSPCPSRAVLQKVADPDATVSTSDFADIFLAVATGFLVRTNHPDCIPSRRSSTMASHNLVSFLRLHKRYVHELLRVRFPSCDIHRWRGVSCCCNGVASAQSPFTPFTGRSATPGGVGWHHSRTPEYQLPTQEALESLMLFLTYSLNHTRTLPCLSGACCGRPAFFRDVSSQRLQVDGGAGLVAVAVLILCLHLRMGGETSVCAVEPSAAQLEVPFLRATSRVQFQHFFYHFLRVHLENCTVMQTFPLFSSVRRLKSRVLYALHSFVIAAVAFCCSALRPWLPQSRCLRWQVVDVWLAYLAPWRAAAREDGSVFVPSDKKPRRLTVSAGGLSQSSTPPAVSAHRTADAAALVVVGEGDVASPTPVGEFDFAAGRAKDYAVWEPYVASNYLVRLLLPMPAHA